MTNRTGHGTLGSVRLSRPGGIMELRYKVWLESDGEIVFGDGLSRLLSGIAQQGSISRAASSMKLSYREAWGRIKRAEESLGVKLLIKQVGGEEGGGARLTPEAEKLLDRYRKFRSEIEAAMRKIFEENFEAY